MAASEAHAGEKVVQFPIPSVLRSFGLDAGQPPTKPAKLSLIGGLLNFYRFHRVDGNLDRETARNRIDGLRGVNEQHSLILGDAFDVYFPVGCPNHPRHKR